MHTQKYKKQGYTQQVKTRFSLRKNTQHMKKSSPAEYDTKYWRGKLKEYLALLPKKVQIYKLIEEHDKFYGTPDGLIQLNYVRYRNASLGPTMRLAKALEWYCKENNLLPKQAA